MLLGAAVSVVTTLVLARFMQPEELAFYAVASTVVSYGTIFQLGLSSGLARQLPILIGEGQSKFGNTIAGQATFAILILWLLVFPLYSIVVYVVTDQHPTMRTILWITGIWIVIRSFSELTLLRLRAESKLLSLSSISLSQRILLLVVGGIVARSFGPVAVVLTFMAIEGMTHAIAGFVYYRRTQYLIPDLSNIRNLIRDGFPIAATGLISSVQLTSERLVLALLAPLTVTGIYQVAAIPVIVGIAFSGITNQFIGPKVLQAYGKSHSLKEAQQFVNKAALSVLGIGLLLSPIVIFATRPLFDIFLPTYLEAVSAFQILYIGTVLIAANLYGSVLIAANKMTRFAQIKFVTSVGTVAMYFVVISITHDLRWIAAANVTSIVVDFSIRYFYARIVSNHQVESSNNAQTNITS